MKRAVYIHNPFCKTICSYCDFCKMFYHSKWAQEYLFKLKEEIMDQYLEDEIKSIYIGGGTPSCLNRKEIEYLLKLTKLFKKEENIEFTFECNLNDITKELLLLLKEYGVNRLSIGIESFNEKKLLLLRRNHTFEGAKEKISLCREIGFKNINLDLIYAAPKETIKDLKEDLRLFLKLNPEHISTYSLMIEPHTILKQQEIQPIEEELDLEMYELICKTLKKQKYSHYEVSNFSKEGKESVHNLTYWNNEEYYGFGLSASGYVDGIRYTNTKNLFLYLKGHRGNEKEIMSKEGIMDNELMLGLRKIKGINKSNFEKKYNVVMENVYPIKPLLKNGDLKLKNGYLFIPIEKIYIMNEILLKMI